MPWRCGCTRGSRWPVWAAVAVFATACNVEAPPTDATPKDEVVSVGTDSDSDVESFDTLPGTSIDRHDSGLVHSERTDTFSTDVPVFFESDTAWAADTDTGVGPSPDVLPLTDRWGSDQSMIEFYRYVHAR